MFNETFLRSKKKKVKISFRHNEVVVSKTQYDVTYMLKVSHDSKGANTDVSKVKENMVLMGEQKRI